jgi:hypothetical protein
MLGDRCARPVSDASRAASFVPKNRGTVALHTKALRTMAALAFSLSSVGGL